MRNWTLGLLGGVALAAVAVPVLAQGEPGRHAPRGAAALFERIDADRDGRVVWGEAWSFVEARFTEADRDRDGGLTMEEARAMAQAAAQRATGGEARPGPERPRDGDRGGRAEEFGAAMFRGLDADLNGRVTLVELRPAIEARFRALDANGDNVVTRDEMPQRGGHHGRDRAGRAPATPPAAGDTAPAR